MGMMNIPHPLAGEEARVINCNSVSESEVGIAGTLYPASNADRYWVKNETDGWYGPFHADELEIVSGE